jgi:apyrase
VPVLLILAVLIIMPRSGPEAATYRLLTTSESKEELPTLTKAREGVDTTDTSKLSSDQKGALQYAVIIDAGSTGSRVHVYKFELVDGRLDLHTDTFESLKPGLSSYDSDAAGAAKSLDPLLQTALKTVPDELQKKTPIKVGATAGLRLLPGGKADDILAAVKQHLADDYPFQLEQVTIIDGTDEGGFAWLTLNYLLGHLGQSNSNTVAAIDLGGGSVQMAYAMSAKEAGKAPDGYISNLSGGGQQYHVYVHSYLGFGLMAARAATLDWEATAAANPCVPLDHTGSFEYGNKHHELHAAKQGADFGMCTKVVSQVMAIGGECGVPKNKLSECTFNGAWGGSKVPAVFYISSYFWDRAQDVGLIPNDKAISVIISPVAFREKGDLACRTPMTSLGSEFASVEEAQRPYLCMDLSFLHTLLTQGFKVPEKAEITVVKKVKYKKEEIEAAWPLGAAINLLSSSSGK